MLTQSPVKTSKTCSLVKILNSVALGVFSVTTYLIWSRHLNAPSDPIVNRPFNPIPPPSTDSTPGLNFPKFYPSLKDSYHQRIANNYVDHYLPEVKVISLEILNTAFAGASSLIGVPISQAAKENLLKLEPDFTSGLRFQLIEFFRGFLRESDLRMDELKQIVDDPIGSRKMTPAHLNLHKIVQEQFLFEKKAIFADLKDLGQGFIDASFVAEICQIIRAYKK